MAWLEIVEGKDRGRKIKLKTGSTYIGRGDSACELTLNDQKVSRLHARVTVLSDGAVTLHDENSSNGTTLRGHRISTVEFLHPGDIFRVGDTGIRLLADSPSEPEWLSYQKDRGDEEGTTCSINLAGGSEYTPAGNFTRALKADEEMISIGRDPANTIVLSHPMVSRFHARIMFRADKRVLYDLNSVNGTYINGQKVNDSTELFPGSLIQICGYSYYFNGRNLIEFNDNDGQIRMEIKSLSKTVKLAGGGARVLLDNLNIVIEPREFVAILGGSGAGKSTLLGALSGMRPATSGEILLNGRNLYDEYDVFRSMIGYVPQDDIVHMDLTVQEVLAYSARLRMPEDTTAEEINATVERVMQDLEIDSRRDVTVYRLSGGQRKRVSIGVELLTSPGIFFLDEPTSGLDPGLEKVMMEMLRRLADQGRTIILVTHATFNIDLCDKVVFLTEGGKLAFFGGPAEALVYFGARDFAEIYKKVSADKTKSASDWAQEYSRSMYWRKYITSNLSQNRAGSMRETNTGAAAFAKPRISRFKQWGVLTRRYLRIMSRDKKNVQLLFLQPLIIAMLIVTVFIHSAPLYEYSKLQPEDVQLTPQVVAAGQLSEVQNNNADETERRKEMSISVAMMIFTAIWLGTSNAAREIVKEMPVYRRERRVNLRIAPYLLSKITVLSVVCLIQSFIFLGVITTGLSLPAFWPNLGAFFLISLASVMMGLTVSATVLNADKAMSTVPVLLVPQILLAGALIPVADVKPDYLHSIFYIAISKWGYELVGGICDISSRVLIKPEHDPFSGNFVAHWWVLVAFIAGFYLLSAWALLRKDQIQD
ncbi:MAG: FHA domain-containing protein [Syntrophomonadaceae bacterium]|nr:FHA domain-containing protein [Syntrophomonadaceae bacterium]